MERLEPVSDKIGMKEFEKLVDFQIRTWALHTKVHYIFSQEDKDKVLAMAYALKDELEKFKKIIGPAVRLSVDLMIGHVKGLITYIENLDVNTLMASAVKSSSQIKKGVEV